MNGVDHGGLKPRRRLKACPTTEGGNLLDVFIALLSVALAGEGFLGPALLAGLQVEGVALDLFDNVFLLDLALESPESALKCFALLHEYFSQIEFTSLTVKCPVMPLADGNVAKQITSFYEAREAFFIIMV